MPEITLIPSIADGQNGWYKTAINVTITTETELPIHYRLVKNGITSENEGDVIYTSSFTIDTVGTTKIYAWIVNEDKEQSAEAEEIVKFDNVPPTITNAIIEGTEGENRWIISNAEIKIEATDNIGGVVQGYTYEVYDMDNILQKKSNGIIDINRKIPVETDGEWKVIIKAIDEAGNESGEKLVEVHKDTEKPSIDRPSIENKTGTGFTITASAGDETSKIARFEYYINGAKHGENKTGIYNVTGLSPNTAYTVEVKVFDNAGLSKMSNSVPVLTESTLEAPSITPAGANTNGYYKEDITITIEDTNNIAVKIKYKLNGGTEATIYGKTGNFKIQEDGEWQIVAWIEDNKGNKSEEANAVVARDTTVQNVTLNVGTATETTIPATAVGEDTVSRNSRL